MHGNALPNKGLYDPASTFITRATGMSKEVKGDVINQLSSLWLDNLVRISGSKEGASWTDIF